MGVPVGGGHRQAYRMFGLTVFSGFPLPGLEPSIAGSEPQVRLDLTDRHGARRAFSGPPSRLAQVLLGRQETIDVSLGKSGDRLLCYGKHAEFYVGSGGSRVLCAPADVSSLGWQRVLLDTVLGTAALAQGYEALHAGAVQLPEGVVAIGSPSGGGKSTLCAELVARGARLFSDDLVFLGRAAGGVVAHPGPPLMTLPEAWAGEGRLLGQVLGVEDGEAWISVPEAGCGPAPLLAVIILDRRRGATGAHVEATGSPVELHALALHSILEGARQRSRFELLADLALQTPVRRLLASPDASPGVLAELVEYAARDLARR